MKIFLYNEQYHPLLYLSSVCNDAVLSSFMSVIRVSFACNDYIRVPQDQISVQNYFQID